MIVLQYVEAGTDNLSQWIPIGVRVAAARKTWYRILTMSVTVRAAALLYMAYGSMSLWLSGPAEAKKAARQAAAAAAAAEAIAQGEAVATGPSGAVGAPDGGLELDLDLEERAAAAAAAAAGPAAAAEGSSEEGEEDARARGGRGLARAAKKKGRKAEEEDGPMEVGVVPLVRWQAGATWAGHVLHAAGVAGQGMATLEHATAPCARGSSFRYAHHGKLQ